MKAWGEKKIIRREDVPPLEPWHMTQLSGTSVQRPHVYVPEVVPAEQEPVAEQAVEESTVVAEAEISMVPMIAEVELDQLKLAAHQEAYADGHAQGRQAGFAEGEVAGREAGHAAGYAAGLQVGRQEAEAEVQHFKLLVSQLATAVADYEDALAQPILDIALAAARQMVRQQLSQSPESLLTVVREAINSLPELQGPLKLELHPDDLALLQTLLAGELATLQWRLEPVAEMERGGCRISNASVELDLSLSGRWRRIVEGLGRSDPWVADDEH
ncbi:MAG: flagellar assembly protein FliH [Chitinimonas sp.]|nr:flagellar assembly protein FliH [Chitinimonas sp.]